MVNDDGGNCYMCYEDMSVNELKRRIKFINTLLRQPECIVQFIVFV